MSSGDSPKRPPAQNNAPAGNPPGTGEGAQSALAAMIKKRQLRADDDAPPAHAPVTQAQQPQDTKKPQDQQPPPG